MTAISKEILSQVANPTVRWEQGVPHDPRSVELMEALAAIDFQACDDYFCWKTGGDGDNGETLMYEMDMFFELKDRGAAEGLKDPRRGGRMAIPEYDSDRYFEEVRKRDDANLKGYCIEDRIEQRLVRIEMLLRYLLDVVKAKEEK